MVAPSVIGRYLIDGLIDHKIISYDLIYRPDTWITYQDIERLWELVNLNSVRNIWDSINDEARNKR